MNQPARANHPISQSFNVMGPNPLSYPSDHGDGNNEASQSQREVQVQTNTGAHSSKYEAQPSTSSGVSTSRTRTYQPFETLLAAVRNETGKQLLFLLVTDLFNTLRKLSVVCLIF